MSAVAGGGGGPIWVRRAMLACLASVMVACRGDRLVVPDAMMSAAGAASTGQSRLLLKAGETQTHLTMPAGAQYLIAVVNTANSPGYAEDFALRGESSQVSPAGSTLGSPSVASSVVTSTGVAGGTSSFKVRMRRWATGPDPHLVMLEHDRALVRGLIARRGNPIASWRALRAAGRAAHRILSARATGGGGDLAPGLISPVVGDRSRVFVRNNLTGTCGDVDTVTARTAYASNHLLVLEDIDSPYAGKMDDFYADTLGPEFDAVTYPEVVANFGDPLLVDSLLSNQDRVTVLFSPLLNRILQGVAGFVNPCDFFPSNTAPVTSDTAIRSNQTEIFYAFVPDDDWPPDDWKRFIRSVAAHETKHVASFAAHLADSALNFEEVWLEEGTAQASAEIWMRHFTQATWRGDNTFAQSVGCELLPDTCGSDVVPLALSQSHFVWLYDFLSQIETESVLGPSTESKYGGAWSMVRWATDQYATSESDFLKGIVGDRVNTGLYNLSARTGRPYQELLMDFYLASASNDYGPAFAPVDPHLRLPSWDQRDIYENLDRAEPALFSLPYPLVPRAVSAGDFLIPVTGIHGGGASLFLLSAPATSSVDETITLTTSAGHTLSSESDLRWGILRVQ